MILDVVVGDFGGVGVELADHHLAVRVLFEVHLAFLPGRHLLEGIRK